MILWVTSPEFKIWVQGPVGRGAGALLLPDSGACGGGASSPRPLPGPSTLTRYPEGADIGPSLPERGGPGGPTSAGAPARRPAARREPGSRGQTRTDQRGPQSRARKARRGAATLRLCLPEPDELCARRPPRQARASAPCLSRRGCRGVGVIPDSPTAACFLPYPGLGEFAAETKVNNWARLRGGSGYHIQVLTPSEGADLPSGQEDGVALFRSDDEFYCSIIKITVAQALVIIGLCTGPALGLLTKPLKRLLLLPLGPRAHGSQRESILQSISA